MANGDNQQVEVYNPEGKYGVIPSSQLQQALGQGYKAKDSYVEAVHPKTGQTGIIPKEQWSAAQAQGFTMSPLEQSRQAMKGVPQYTGPEYAGKPTGFLPSRSRAGLPQGEPDVQSTLGALPAVGGAIGGAFGNVPGAALGGGAGEAARQLITRAANTGEQNQMQDLRTAAAGPWQSPAANIAKQSAIMGTAEGVGKYVISPAVKFGGKQIAKLFAETPERLAALDALPAQETAINQKIVQAEASSRAAFKSAYDSMGIDAAPVNVAGAKNLARDAVKTLPQIASSVPRAVARVARLPEPSEVGMADPIYNDLNARLDALSKMDTIPFRQAQQLREAIGTYIRRAGGKLPAESYNSLASVRNAISDSLRTTADNEGVLPQFNAAEKMFQQHAADFWNKGSPLGQLLKTRSDQIGATLNKFMDTANRARIMDTLERRGVPTDDIRALLAPGDKALSESIDDAARLKQLGQGVYNQQVATANRRAAIPYAVKAGAGISGLGAVRGLYEAFRLLRSKK